VTANNSFHAFALGWGEISQVKIFPCGRENIKMRKAIDARKIGVPYAGCYFPENYPVKQQESVVAKRLYFTHAVIDS
jgi:hypothetical protein